MKASVVCPDGVGDGALSDARQRALRPQLRSCGEWPSSSSKMSVSPSHFEPTVISSFVGEIVFMRGSAVLDPDPCPVQSSKIDLYSLSPLRLVTTLRLYYTYTTPRPTLQPRSSRRLVFPPPSSWRLDEHGVGPPTAWTTATFPRSRLLVTICICALHWFFVTICICALHWFFTTGLFSHLLAESLALNFTDLRFRIDPHDFLGGCFRWHHEVVASLMA